jgi:hypothetical protein
MNEKNKTNHSVSEEERRLMKKKRCSGEDEALITC